MKEVEAENFIWNPLGDLVFIRVVLAICVGYICCYTRELEENVHFYSFPV